MITLKSQLNRAFDKPHFEDIVKDLHKLNQQILSFSNGNGFNLMLESTVNQTTSGTVFFPSSGMIFTPEEAGLYYINFNAVAGTSINNVQIEFSVFVGENNIFGAQKLYTFQNNIDRQCVNIPYIVNYSENDLLSNFPISVRFRRVTGSGLVQTLRRTMTVIKL